MPEGKVICSRRFWLRSSRARAVSPSGKVRLVRKLLPWIRSQFRFVRPFGRETLVSPFKLRLRKVRPVRLEGRLKLPKRFWDRSRLFNRVRFVGKAAVLSRFDRRLSESKLVA